MLGRLVVQQLIDAAGNDGPWTLKEHLRAPVEALIDQAPPAAGNLVTAGSDQANGTSDNLVTLPSDQATPELPPRPIRALTEAQRSILLFCDVPKRPESIMEHLGMTHRTHFRTRHLRPLIEANLLQPTHPDNPTHPSQAYVVAPAALELIARLISTDSTEK